MKKTVLAAVLLCLIVARSGLADTIRVEIAAGSPLAPNTSNQTFDIMAFLNSSNPNATVQLEGLNLSVQLGGGVSAPAITGAYFGGLTVPNIDNTVFDGNNTGSAGIPDATYPAYWYDTITTNSGSVTLGTTPKILARMTVATAGPGVFNVILDANSVYNLSTQLLSSTYTGSVDLQPDGRITVGIPEPLTLVQLLGLTAVGLPLLVRRLRRTRRA